MEAGRRLVQEMGSGQVRVMFRKQNRQPLLTDWLCGVRESKAWAGWMAVTFTEMGSTKGEGGITPHLVESLQQTIR